MVYIISVLIGIVTAFIGSLVGLGGGMILIPILLFLHQYSTAFSWATPQTIVGISLVVMVFTALSSTISYFKKGRVDYKTGLLFLIGSIPGGMFGSWLNQYIQFEHFTMYFGILMIAISMLLMIKRNENRNVQPSTNLFTAKRTFELNGETYHFTVNMPLAFTISFIVGILSGLFGIGGGAIMVPAMILLFGFPAHIATATSMFMIFFISIINASTHIALGHVVWEYVIFFIPAAWIGGRLGAYVSQKLTGTALVRILRLILIVIGLRLIYEGLG